MDTALLSLKNICKNYGNQSILYNVSLKLAAAGRVALMGPSGSGKTTLLNCISGLEKPDSGSIHLNNQDITHAEAATWAEVRRRQIGSVFQFFHLLPTLTAAENVAFPLLLLGITARERHERVAAALHEVNLSHRADALPATLSGGEMQRVAIARALIHRPSLILADEPTGSLDSRSGQAVLDLLQRLTEAHHIALLMVTHSPEAASICHSILHMRDGRLTAPAIP